MYYPTEQQLSLTQTLHYLAQLQQELRILLAQCSVGEPVSPRHSLYSSRRVFRADELTLGLHRGVMPAGFSAN